MILLLQKITFELYFKNSHLRLSTSDFQQISYLYAIILTTTVQ